MSSGLPMDPIMLYSVINTKLRDQYSSLEQLCEDMHEDPEQIMARLEAVGFEYDREQNRFR